MGLKLRELDPVSVIKHDKAIKNLLREPAQ